MLSITKVNIVQKIGITGHFFLDIYYIVDHLR